MDDIFNPSLLISLGPSSRRALDFSKELLAYLPEYLLNLIDFYYVEDIDKLSKEVQEIIDNRLLAAKHLNNLVDMGYKVRSENLTAVKINIYILWDAYSTSLPVCEVVRRLTELSYGNIDKNQHSGVCLFIIPILEKEWLSDEDNSVNAVNNLRDIVDYISTKDTMLSIDSKVYILHCIAKDGTRIPMEELEYISALAVYLNIIPSKEPPLSSFNRRLIMHESDYKVGTIGIACLAVFRGRLLEEFSRYMAIDIISHCTDYEERLDFERKYSLKLKEKIEYKSQRNNNQVRECIERDLNDIIYNYSLKEGFNYLDFIERKVMEEEPLLDKVEPEGYLKNKINFKRLLGFFERYKKTVLKSSEAAVNQLSIEAVESENKEILNFISSEKDKINKIMESLKIKSSLMALKVTETGTVFGNLITDLLDIEDRKRFYMEYKPSIFEMYAGLIRSLKSIEELGSVQMEEVLLRFARNQCLSKINLDFNELLSFKYKENKQQEISRWIDRGLVKSKYLLQYTSSKLEEEHSLFIISPEVYKLSKDILSNKLGGFKVSVIDGKDLYTNCISIMKLCLGVDLNHIIPIKRFIKDKVKE